jgi:DNA-binding NarL/FixJ family response regulator
VFVIETDTMVRILLADAHSLFREAVKAVLDGENNLEVIAEAKDGVEAVTLAIQSQPDVALVDANLPNGDGIKATQMIKERVPDARVVVLADDEDQETLVGAVEAGANGYLTKESPLADLIDATRAIYAGETLIPRAMLGPLLARLIRRRKDQDHALKRMSRLTHREKEVLALLAGGADNDAIAEALVISPQTARTHIQNILGKLGVHSRLEAAAFVITNRLSDDLIPVA